MDRRSLITGLAALPALALPEIAQAAPSRSLADDEFILRVQEFRVVGHQMHTDIPVVPDAEIFGVRSHVGGGFIDSPVIWRPDITRLGDWLIAEQQSLDWWRVIANSASPLMGWTVYLKVPA